jgi:hypothetical protein
MPFKQHIGVIADRVGLAMIFVLASSLCCAAEQKDADQRFDLLCMGELTQYNTEGVGKDRDSVQHFSIDLVSGEYMLRSEDSSPRKIASVSSTLIVLREENDQRRRYSRTIDRVSGRYLWTLDGYQSVNTRHRDAGWYQFVFSSLACTKSKFTPFSTTKF